MVPLKVRSTANSILWTYSSMMGERLGSITGMQGGYWFESSCVRQNCIMIAPSR